MSAESEKKKVFSDAQQPETDEEVRIRRLGTSRTRKTVLRKHRPAQAEEFFRSC